MHSNNYHNKSISETLSGITAILFWSITAPVIASATGVDPFKAALTSHTLLALFLVMCAIGTARYGEKLDKRIWQST
jgi:hypothetical protein